MVAEIRIQFDASQKHQLDAVNGIVNLLEGLPFHTPASFKLGDEIVPNLPQYENLSENWLLSNVLSIQQEAGFVTDLASSLEVDDGMVLEGAGSESWRFPSFTIEMETGTGKTYVYLRTIYELRQHYGFSKFIIVVPSIAIYEGVIKNFQITRDHFRALYGNETVNLIEYDGSKLSQLRAFATSTFVEVLVITMDSFNKASNVIFKPSEKLPGDRKPYQFIQETRPILILDEPQNMRSEKSKEALRTLHPLFALRFSATHKETPNLIYRLTPFDAYRLNLVKKIQVFGVTERENFNQSLLGLEEITLTSGIKARVRTYQQEGGRVREADVTLKQGDDLYLKTHREEFKEKYVVAEINAAQGFVEFENGLRITANDTLGLSKTEVFRAQIRETIDQHFKMQEQMLKKNVKVLSLFFIDRVGNYTEKDGIIRRLFDEEFEKRKKRSEFFKDRSVEEVRSAYFAVYRGQVVETEEDEAKKTKEDREAEKAAFELIMKDKERLLSFDEKTCFIFAHSALKEGWDNPNVFQICTLRQTASEMRKRQEIGRGLRLAVNQEGKRVFDEDVNILSVIANESYQSYAAGLQTEYHQAGYDEKMPMPSNGYRGSAKRNDEIFEKSKAFRDFWAKLQRHTSYRIHVDTPKLVQECVDRINNRPTPQATIVVEKGRFVITDYQFELISVSGENCKLKITITDTDGNVNTIQQAFKKGDDLSKKPHRDERLRGFKIVNLTEEGDTSQVVFGNGQQIFQHTPLRFQSEQGQRTSPVTDTPPRETYPVFNLIDRAAKETGLTRPTINEIFRCLTDKKKQSIFSNPEGFAGMFINEIINALADHVADRIEFVVEPAPLDWGDDLEDMFPQEKVFPQKELVKASGAGLYDLVQVDSEVEERFVRDRLNEDDDVIFYFKFPPAFKIDFPRIIGNYNPDWGIARYGEDHKIVLELVRETKGSEELDTLRFPSERRKIDCARKHFEAIGINYRVVTDRTPTWWKQGDENVELPGFS